MGDLGPLLSLSASGEMTAVSTVTKVPGGSFKLRQQEAALELGGGRATGDMEKIEAEREEERGWRGIKEKSEGTERERDWVHIYVTGSPSGQTEAQVCLILRGHILHTAFHHFSNNTGAGNSMITISQYTLQSFNNFSKLWFTWFTKGLRVYKKTIARDYSQQNILKLIY